MQMTAVACASSNSAATPISASGCTSTTLCSHWALLHTVHTPQAATCRLTACACMCTTLCSHAWVHQTTSNWEGRPSWRSCQTRGVDTVASRIHTYVVLTALRALTQTQ
eukprot:362021-Chlamydomonas_euryale.AAC.2